MTDGRIDGNFRIDKGGITQGIQKELGLSSQECKQLGSVWTQIINEFDDSNNMQVSNNKNETPNKSNNYEVHKDAIVQFSKDCWKRIVDLVNKTLHKNIQIEEAKKYIKTNFKASGLDKKLFMECLNNITLDIESNGAGRVEDGTLAIETNDTDIPEWTEDRTAQARMVKLLVHEAYHLYLDKDGKHTKEATKEEEATAEMLALRTMANLCKNDSSLKPFEIYGQTISDFTSNETIANNPKFNSDFLANYTTHTGTIEDAIRKAKENVKL